MTAFATITDTLARTCTSPLGQAALLAHPRFGDLLADNPHLCDAVWYAMFDRPGYPYLKARMLEQDVTSDRLDRASRVRNISVLRTLAATHDLTEDQARRVLGRLRREPVALRHWITYRHYPAGIEAELIGAVTADERPRFLARSPHQFDQDAFLDLMHQESLGAEAVEVALAVYGNPNAGPDVQQAALATARAHARPQRVGRPSHRASVSHLPALTRPWNQADTAGELDLLRALCSVGQVPRVTAARMAVRAAERERQDSSLGRLGEDITAYSITGGISELDMPVTQTAYTAGAALAAQALTTQLDALGPAAWETAAALLAGDYTGGVTQLVATCQALLAAPEPAAAAEAPPVSVRRARSSGAPAREQ